MRKNDHWARHILVHYRQIFKRIAAGRLGINQDDVRLQLLDFRCEIVGIGQNGSDPIAGERQPRADFTSA